MEDRLIKYPNRNSQILEFSGLNRMRGIVPTDIDGFIDYGGSAFVYFDAKFGDAEVARGQRTAYENAVNSHRKAGNKACAFIFRHNTPTPEHVIVKDCIVDEVYTENGWEKYNKTVLELIEAIEKRWQSQGVNL